MNSFDLSRSWFNFSFDNPEKIKPIHSAIFFFAVEHCNRLGNKEKFGFPSQMTMDAIGVKNYQTYGKALKDLEDWGFIRFIERSKNQYSANIISISAPTKNGTARNKALDKATLKHASKQTRSIVSIDKPYNQETKEPFNQVEIEKQFQPEVSLVYNTVIDLFPKNTKPKDDTDKKKWFDCIRLLIEKDKINYQYLIEIIIKARKDDFWKKNFLSILKLRKTNKEGIKYWVVLENKFKKNNNHERFTELVGQLRENNPNL